MQQLPISTKLDVPVLHGAVPVLPRTVPVFANIIQCIPLSGLKSADVGSYRTKNEEEDEEEDDEEEEDEMLISWEITFVLKLKFTCRRQSYNTYTSTADWVSQMLKTKRVSSILLPYSHHP